MNHTHDKADIELIGDIITYLVFYENELRLGIKSNSAKAFKNLGIDTGKAIDFTSRWKKTAKAGVRVRSREIIKIDDIAFLKERREKRAQA